jgi:2-hydroxy-6-oxonona-2,4-dienedioate hydrolase
VTALSKCPLGQTIYAPDFPGYGNSPGPRQALGMAALADWAVRFMEQIGIARAHIAGNSMGCQVAMEIARRHPARVGGLVLVGPTTGAKRVPYWRYMAGLVLDGFREPIRYNIALLKMYSQMGLRRYLETVRKMREDEPFTYAAEVAVPCLILRGEHDRIVPNRVAQELADALPAGSFVLVSGTAHALQFHAPQKFVALAVPFWRDSEG